MKYEFMQTSEEYTQIAIGSFRTNDSNESMPPS